MKSLLFMFCSLVPVQMMAAILVVDDHGILTGAQNVDVEGTMYNMQFLTGNGHDIFYNSSAGIYEFDMNYANSAAFAQAVSEQVWGGIYDEYPQQTLGCNETYGCIASMPYEHGDDFGTEVLRTVRAINMNGTGGMYDYSSTLVDTDWSSLWIDWTLADESVIYQAEVGPKMAMNVPEPSFLAFITLCGLGLISRRYMSVS